MRKYFSQHKPSMIYLSATLFLSLGLLLVARNISGFGQFYACNIFPVFPNTLGRAFSLVPFSVFEFSLYLFVIAALILMGYGIFRMIRILAKKGKIESLQPIAIQMDGGPRPAKAKAPFLTFFCICTTLLLLFTLGCGINYSRNGFLSDAQLLPAPSSKQALIKLSDLLIEDLKQLEEEFPSGAEDFRLTTAETEQTCKDAMQTLGQEFPVLSGYYPNPKQVLLSRQMSYLGISGIYSPFTIEASYNVDVPTSLIPFTICHELAHLKGYIMEEDAGFIGYLACAKSNSPELRYSGALNGLSYVLGPLYKACDKEEYANILKKIPAQALQDLQIRQEYWVQFSGPVSQVASKANDTYLKANAQTDGVKSYGRMVDSMIAYYRLDATPL